MPSSSASPMNAATPGSPERRDPGDSLTERIGLGDTSDGDSPGAPNPDVCSDYFLRSNRDGPPEIAFADPVYQDFTAKRVLSADFTGDGNDDVFAWGERSSILLAGDGNGGFAQPIEVDLGWGPFSDVAVADLDQDGLADIVTTGENASLETFGLAQVLYGGELDDPFPWAVPVDAPVLGPVQVVIGDYDGDGRKDIGLCTALGECGVLFGADGRSFGPFVMGPVDIVAPLLANAVSWDFNGDGRQTFFYLSPAGNSSLTSLPAEIYAGPVFWQYDFVSGAVAGHVMGSATLDHAHAVKLVASDLQGDGVPELIVASGNSVLVSWSSDEGDYFHSSYCVGALSGATHSFPTAMDVGRFDADRELDIVTLDPIGSSLGFLVKRPGIEGYMLPRTLSVPFVPKDLTATDLDGDGDSDLVVATEYSGLAVMINQAQ